ncbi:MAG: NAD(+) synthase [Clostridia bacterium]|nr:NAD(+) synthase [Clostridia bacterium]
MKFGYAKVCAVTPEVKVADVQFNTSSIIDCIDKAYNENGAEIIVFPELCLTGATCGDLFFTDVLQEAALLGLKEIAKNTLNKKALIFVGLPLRKNNKLYNVAAVINEGKVLSYITKTAIGGVSDLGENRYFSSLESNLTFDFFGQEIPLGKNFIFTCKDNQNLTVGVEIGGDLLQWTAPSGANLIVNLCATPITVGKSELLQENVLSRSRFSKCGYILSNAGEGESTSEMVFGGCNVVCENGKLLNSTKPFGEKYCYTEIDLSFIASERTKGGDNYTDSQVQSIDFTCDGNWGDITRVYEKTPFVPTEEKMLGERAELILSIQAEGLKKRVAHAHSGSVVLGLSGGLDSTLAILVAVTAMKKLNRPLKDVIALTMPCFGTTSRTFQNTIKLGKALGVTLKKVDIGKAVTRHLKDINHPLDLFDVTFENAQARERTQVLMDVANMSNGLVIGTGDLSEVALGWSTYNGDHMSMYAVNNSIPKTLVRHVVEAYANKSKGKLKAVLMDILDTPVSPELLPAENDAISQKTEDIVGPYILHDFFLFNMVRRGFSPEKLYYVACKTFEGDFKKETILKWLKIFVKRFFIQQFKRSCAPDGIKVGSVGLSARGEWKMPSDAVCKLWLDQLENL